MVKGGIPIQDRRSEVPGGTAREILRQSVIHEIQHAIQGLEGFARGSSLSEIIPRLVSEGKLPASARYKSFEQLSPEDGNIAYKAYLSVSGEAEARDVEAKINLTDWCKDRIHIILKV
jgi:hypothetical protein